METELVKVDELRAEVAPVVQRARDMVIVTPEDYTLAAQGLKDIKAALKKVDAFFDPGIESACKTWKLALAQKATLADPLQQAEEIFKEKQKAWAKETERVRLAEEARLNALEQERARKKQAALLKKAESVKSPELQESYREQATNVQANSVTLANLIPDIKGQSIRKTWKAEIVDGKAAVTALLQFPDWSAYITINHGQLDKFAARTKGAVAVAGVEMYADSVMSSTAK